MGCVDERLDNERSWARDVPARLHRKTILSGPVKRPKVVTLPLSIALETLSRTSRPLAILPAHAVFFPKAELRHLASLLGEARALGPKG